MILRKENFNMKDIFSLSRILVFILLLLNFAIWFKAKDIKPDLIITPTPPGVATLKAAGLGDDQFIYRYLGLQLQIAGDDYGTTTPLQDYNYTKLEKWFYLLHDFDKVSEYVPSVAGFYYGNSQNDLDNVHIIDYLIKYADSNPNQNWRWYTTSLYIASVKLKDTSRIKEIGEKMTKLDKDIVPLWGRVLGIFFAKSIGDQCAAFNMLRSLKEEDLVDISEDKTFGNQGDDKNIFVKLLKHRIDEIKNNPSIIAKCMTM